MPRNRHEALARAHRHDAPTLTQPEKPTPKDTAVARAVARGDIPPEVDAHVVHEGRARRASTSAGQRRRMSKRVIDRAQEAVLRSGARMLGKRLRCGMRWAPHQAGLCALIRSLIVHTGSCD